MTEDLNQEHISQDLLVVSTNDIDGVEIVDYVGIVQGSTVRSRNVGSDIFANLKNLVGGELVGYSKLLQTLLKRLSVYSLDFIISFTPLY